MYPYFPEEQVPGAAAFFAKLVDKDSLYIHRNGFSRFSNSMNQERLKIVLAFQKEKPELYRMLVSKDLSSEEISNLMLPSHVVAFSDIMADFFEIMVTVQMLRDSHVYLNELPDPGEPAVSRYVRYHLSNHFNEFFILTERMIGLLKTIQRLYRKDPRFHAFSMHFNFMKSIPANAMKVIRRERNYHVHEKRYTDPDLEELENIEFDLLFQITDPQIINPLYKEKIEKYHGQLLEKVKATIDVTDEMLNLFFAILYQFLFSEEGDFMPSRESQKGC